MHPDSFSVPRSVGK